MKDVGFDTINIPNFLRKDNGIGRPADTRTSAERKGQPVWSGCFQYFPDALVAVAELSKAGNDKHNPGEPLHWSREKSSDHADCVGRHLIDLGPDWTDVDHEDGLLHAQKLAWRALAVLQIAIERRRGKSVTATAAPLAPTPDAWIEWNGGDCPVLGPTQVKVEFRDGTVRDPAPASWWTWRHRIPQAAGDIIAYRVVKA